MNMFRSAKLYNRREPFRYTVVTELRTFLRNKDMQNKTTETMRYIVVIIPAVMKLVSDITVGPTVHVFVQSVRCARSTSKHKSVTKAARSTASTHNSPPALQIVCFAFMLFRRFLLLHSEPSNHFAKPFNTFLEPDAI